MPVVVPRRLAVQYDGSNSAEILATVGLETANSPGRTWQVQAETGGVLTLRVLFNGGVDGHEDHPISGGEWLVMTAERNFPGAADGILTGEVFQALYLVVG